MRSHARLGIRLGQNLLHDKRGVETRRGVFVLDHDVSIPRSFSLGDGGEISMSVFPEIGTPLHLVGDHVGGNGDPFGLKDGRFFHDDFFGEGEFSDVRGRRYGDSVGGAVEIHRLEEGGQFGGEAFGAGGTGGFGSAGGGDEIGPYSGRVGFLGQMGQLFRLRSEGGPVFSDRVRCRGGLASSYGSRLSILLDVFELLVDEAGSSDEEGVGDGGGEVERGGGEV
mmetsp:Transcript_25617/g.53907  ORF Transcript_25617/g.53907 Transcript_25617/m.53907 type:complete len:224 (-) Transcript_25617:154-825(-)